MRSPACRMSRRPRRANERWTLALRVTGVSRSFGGLRAVDDCSFEVRQGTITGLIGPNGAGKSTMLNLLAGALRPRRGLDPFLRPGDRRPARLQDRAAGHRAHLPALLRVRAHDRAGKPDGRAAEPARRLGVGGAARSARLDARGAPAPGERPGRCCTASGWRALAHEYAGNLSGGQKRLLELARALQLQPRLLLLDEPMAGVNPALIAQLADYIAELERRGTHRRDGRARDGHRRAAVQPDHRDGAGPRAGRGLHGRDPGQSRGGHGVPERATRVDVEDGSGVCGHRPAHPAQGTAVSAPPDVVLRARGHHGRLWARADRAGCLAAGPSRPDRGHPGAEWRRQEHAAQGHLRLSEAAQRACAAARRGCDRAGPGGVGQPRHRLRAAGAAMSSPRSRCARTWRWAPTCGAAGYASGSTPC